MLGQSHSKAHQSATARVLKNPSSKPWVGESVAQKLGAHHSSWFRTEVAEVSWWGEAKVGEPVGWTPHNLAAVGRTTNSHCCHPTWRWFSAVPFIHNAPQDSSWPRYGRRQEKGPQIFNTVSKYYMTIWVAYFVFLGPVGLPAVWFGLWS